MSLNFHSTQKIKAEAMKGQDTEWLELSVIDHNGAENDIAIFFQPRGVAERLADAINAVFDEVKIINAQYRDREREANTVPAGHTDAFADECQADVDDERQHGWAV